MYGMYFREKFIQSWPENSISTSSGTFPLGSEKGKDSKQCIFSPS